MEKFELDECMVESIEYMRSQEGLSFYGIINAIASEDSNSNLFNGHATKILKHFNDFDEREDDEDFIKCYLGYYTVKAESKGVKRYRAIIHGEKETEKREGAWVDSVEEVYRLGKIGVDFFYGKFFTIEETYSK